MNHLKRIWIWVSDPRVLFVAALLVCSLLYNYHRILFFKPVGIHQWRNCTSAAMALNYYHGGSFLEPQTNALLADNFNSDVTIIEFPAVYYLVSILYRLFGMNEFWFRLTQVLLGFIGLYYLFRAGKLLLGSWFYASIIPLIIFSSPIYVFYTNNFIPDATALSISFIGIYFLVKYRSKQSFKEWLLAMFFFLIAGLIKTSSLMTFFAVGGVGLIEWLFSGRKLSGKVFSWRYGRYVLSYLVVLSIVIGWYLYAKVYADLHGGSVSAVEIRPFWIMTKDDISTTWEVMKGRFHAGDYHYPFFLAATAGIFVFLLFRWRSFDKNLFGFMTLTMIGALAFTLLFFRSMHDHDYYQVNNLIILVYIYTGLFALILNRYRRIADSAWFRVVIFVALLILLNGCRLNMLERYRPDNWHYNWSANNIELFDIEPMLREMGIARTDRVYCTPDFSINISLYLCDQKGYTDLGISQIPLGERINIMLGRGIDYLIIGKDELIKTQGGVELVPGKKIGETGGVVIFKIDPE